MRTKFSLWTLFKVDIEACIIIIFASVDIFSARMHSLNEKQRRQFIIDYWIRHNRCSKYQVVKYFKEMDIAERTVYEVLKHYEERETSERLPGSGTVAKKMPDKNVKKMLKEMTGVSNPCSTRTMAKKYDISKSYVNKISLEHGLRAFKIEKRSFVNEKQEEVQCTRIVNLTRMLRNENYPVIIIDDESYFTFQHGG